MKHTLTFSLPEEQDELDITLDARKNAYIVEQLCQYLRQKIKYASDSMTDDQISTYRDVQTKLYELKNDE